MEEDSLPGGEELHYIIQIDSVTVCGIDNILRNKFHIHLNAGIFCIILSVPRDIVMRGLEFVGLSSLKLN